mgnify:FL=1
MKQKPVSLELIDFTNKFRLANKNIVLTGSTGLLGSAHAIALAQFGANVICTDINLEKIDQQVASLTSRYPSQHQGYFRILF